MHAFRPSRSAKRSSSGGSSRSTFVKDRFDEDSRTEKVPPFEMSTVRNSPVHEDITLLEDVPVVVAKGGLRD